MSMQQAVRGTLFLIITAGLASLLAVHRAAASAPIKSPFPGAAGVAVGTVLPGARLVHRVDVRNPSNLPLHFTAFQSSCGCTSGALNPVTIRPGKFGVLTLRLHAPAYPGRKEVMVWLKGLCGKKRIVRQFLVNYRVRRMIRLSAAGARRRPLNSFILPPMDYGQKPHKLVVEITRGGYAAKWDRLACRVMRPGLAAALRRTSGTSWRLTLPLVDAHVLGGQSYPVRFSFYDGAKRLNYHLTLPANVAVRGPVKLAPDDLFYSRLVAGSARRRTILLALSHGAAGPVGRITRAESASPNVALKVIRNGHELAVTLRPGAAAGQISGIIVVHVKRKKKTYVFQERYLGYVVKAKPNCVVGR